MDTTRPPVIARDLHLAGLVPSYFMHALLGGIFACCGGIRRTGVENVPENGPVLFCPNHISDSDPAALYCCLPRHDVYYMGKQELFKIPFMSQVFRYYGGFPVKRDSADRTALRKADGILRTGRCLVVFPEGGIVRPGRPRPFQPGAALIALKTNTTIVPVAITGTPGVLPYGSLIPRRSDRTVRVSFGQPIYMDAYHGLGRHEALDAILSAIRVELAALAAPGF